MHRGGGGYATGQHGGSAQMSNTWAFRDPIWSESGAIVGYQVEGTDGPIGKIDEATTETGAAYIVVDTGPWILGKKRLIPAGAVTVVDHDSGIVTVSLSKDQVKAGPDYDEAG